MHLDKLGRQLRWSVHLSRTFGYQIPAPPPLRQQPRITTFSDTARPRPYLVRKKELPEIKGGLALVKRPWLAVVACSVTGVSAWTLFWTDITIEESLSSPIMKELIHVLRSDTEVKMILGEAIMPEGQWWHKGRPRVYGSVDIPHGYVDIRFRVEGSNGSGTVYFTSKRRDEAPPFDIVRFKVVADDGTVCKVDMSSGLNSRQ
ncbi:uncharacterized protein BT62DRAFT_954777, partial [Guyanagaster necrorhizus]